MQRKFSKGEQGTDEWLQDRIGFVTASNMAAVLGNGATHKNYLVKVLCEELSGQAVQGFKSQAMQDGNDNEATARLAYELHTGSTVTTAGFCFMPELKLGASTDGIVEGTDGLIEIKNVIPATQIDFLTTGKIKRDYLLQMQAQMFVLDKQWCDFVSQSLGDEVYGELPEKYKLKIVRVKRDEKVIKEILEATKRFHEELEVLKEKLDES